MDSSESKKSSNRYSLEDLEKKIFDLLDTNPHGLNINQIASLLEINRNTISKWLKTLEAKNKIISRKTGVSTLYYKTEKKTNILAGPYFIVVERTISEKTAKTDKFIIKKFNTMYLDRINEINESLIGSDLFNFFPFNEYREKLIEFLQQAIKSLTTEKEIYSDKIELTSPDESKEIFQFKIMAFEDKTNQYVIEFSDLTLSKLLEEQLVNSETFQLLLDLFQDKYISIQTSDGKILMANHNVIADFNNGMPLTNEPVFCYDLYRNRSNLCDNCPGIQSIKKNKKQHESYELKGQKFEIDAIPIKSKDTDLKGYIFFAEKSVKKKN